ncbi:7,8-dihydropterin-6-yl-methyl-4-(beta-D-ribofuranosyl)aminobenzene 5'-phosphate synthase [Methanococcus maripaludis]|uniref:7, 8-dihydropterin-6-yl-methyl-4-(Beta-D-ribofuranosyl)aminobenzene 5'-phosphate synthase n=1 Tax=Methanococcus maripaludis TaxID=39152 RepID=A0A7J9S6J5_METMI|nr:MBL fold metallo-hydrolase [Methanococcus maripaludis]MBB6402275.1 7,8-dihydropterin-6-yl-methyl-4-(beta-D-ribofuranosyl)aminobenzene 5'-phosphate synthase [Methanococcus maripaludis]
MEIKILVDNTAKGKFLAQSGFSVIIKDNDSKILFDCGQSPLVFENNLKLIDENDIFDAVIFSHGHYDHTDGFNYFIEKYAGNLEFPVYIHKSAFFDRYHGERYIGIDESIKNFLKNYKNLKIVEDPVKISENLIISGTIPRTNFYEREDFERIENGQRVDDIIIDDMFVIVKDIILSGCTHSGVINCIEHAKTLNEINGIIGGFHMGTASENYINQVKSYLMAQNFKLISPMHCTGFNATKELSDMTGFKFGHVGSVFEI